MVGDVELREILMDELLKSRIWNAIAGRPLEEIFGDKRAAALLSAMRRARELDVNIDALRV